METLTESGAITLGSAADFIALAHATVSIAATIATPKVGHLLIIAQTSTGTAGHTVTLTSGSFDTNGSNTLTLNAQNALIVLYGVSNSQYIVLLNVGSVGLSVV